MSIQAVIISININSRSSAHIMVMFLAAGEPLKAARCVYAAAVRAGVVFQPSTPAPPAAERRETFKSSKRRPVWPICSSLSHASTTEIGSGRAAFPALPGFISNHGGKGANNGVCLKEDYPAPTSVHQILCYTFHPRSPALLFFWLFDSARSALGPVTRC